MATPAAARVDVPTLGSRVGRWRWVICALLFFCTTINYIDRQVLGILAPDLQREIGWSELDYGRIVIAFQVSYAAMMLVWGGILDRIGTKLGLTIAVAWWSLAGMGTALANTAIGFGFARFLLGVGEAANFPASIKTVAEWFPKSERAFATGIFNSGTNIGAIVAPIAVPLLAATWGWRAAFILTGAIGFVWLAAWMMFYHPVQTHPKLQPRERAYIRDGAEEAVGAKVPLAEVLRYRQLWAFALGKMLTDPVWWFYLFWLPKFLASEHDIRGVALIPYLTTVYIISDIGSILGGYLSSTLIKRGWSVNSARKTALGAVAAIVPSVILASQTRSAWTAVLLIGLATACHQAWSANIFTLASDMFPRRAVGTVVGFGGFAGGVGGILIAEFAGRVLNRDPSYYLPMFVVGGTLYAIALAVIHLLAPRLEPAKLRTA
ncbi:MAG TPA: MFS transporter [Vicinamibacterales bacterium]|nr:MFS transporter [Vicinamibacterales bacterium]